MADNPIEVEHNEAARRFEAQIEGVCAVLEYEPAGERIIFTHTRVPDALEGRGIASALARAALEDARTRKLAVVPRCEFVRGYIRRHPEYLPLVALEFRSRLD